ncbi:MAG TPA: hypothetical protein VMG41_15395 [Gemmatimonadales bacterium]|nr:hypothetical protein [Gemmatimonadales bacterium]
MRTLRRLAAGSAVLLTLFVPALGFAQGGPSQSGGGHADAMVALRFGTLGFGLEVNKLLIGHVGVRVGGNYFKFSTTKDQSNITYNASLKLQAFSALIDLYPGNRGGFHFTGGLMTDPAKVTATGKPAASDSFDINGTRYPSSAVGTLTGEAKFPGVLPYVGIGFGTPARDGSALKFLFDLGAAIGKATISLNATGAGSNPALASDLKAQQTKTQNDVQKYAKVYPVISFGIGYAF